MRRAPMRRAPMAGRRCAGSGKGAEQACIARIEFLRGGGRGLLARERLAGADQSERGDSQQDTSAPRAAGRGRALACIAMWTRFPHRLDTRLQSRTNAVSIHQFPMQPA